MKRLPGVGDGTDLYALTDDALSLGRPVLDVAKALLGAGIRILQYREKDKKAGRMLEECRALRELTRAAGACLIVNDHVDIALLCEADGVHVGQDDLPVPEVRRLVGPDMIIGLSTHSPEQARAAEAAGADYIGVGPIYPTQTKKDVCAPVTLDYLDWVVANSPLPFVAIGSPRGHARQGPGVEHQEHPPSSPQAAPSATVPRSPASAASSLARTVSYGT